MYDIVQKKELLNRLGTHLLGGERFIFRAVSLDLPNLQPAELGFIRSVSWLFVHYNEAGRPSIKFLVEKLPAFDLDPDGLHAGHRRMVGRLRTFSQHNLDPTASHDRSTKRECEDWMEHHCNIRVPIDEDEWACCMHALHTEAVAFFEALVTALRRINDDPHRSMIRTEWSNWIERDHSPAEFDGLISETARDMGRGELDSIRFRERHYESWNKHLKNLSLGYDFKREARKLIEQSLLNDVISVLPITGEDIMHELGVRPGLEVDRILFLAQRIYNRSPCSAPELIANLRDQLG